MIHLRRPPTRLRILIAAADPGEVGAAVAALGGAGHEVTTAYRPETTLARLAEERPDVVLLDPSLGGTTLVGRVRAFTPAPLLVIADLADEARVAAALDAGADDVVGRPVRPLELLARVHAAVRWSGAGPGSVPILDGLQVELERHEASVAGHALALTPIEFDLLAAMAARRGGVVDHRVLARAAWPDPAAVDPETIRTHLGRLNAKLVAAGHPGLRNVRRRGYALRVEGGRFDEA